MLAGLARGARGLPASAHAGRRVPRAERADGRRADRGRRASRRTRSSSTSRSRSNRRSTGCPGVRRVRSASAISLSLVWVEFDWAHGHLPGAPARRRAPRRPCARSLPENAHAEITPITSITGEIMLLALSSPDGRSQRSRAPRLRRVRPAQPAARGARRRPGASRSAASCPSTRSTCRQDRLALFGLTHPGRRRGRARRAQHGQRRLPAERRPPGAPDPAGRARHGASTTSGRRWSPITRASPSRSGRSPTSSSAPRRSAAPPPTAAARRSSSPSRSRPGTNTLALTREIDRVLDQAQGRPARRASS